MLEVKDVSCGYGSGPNVLNDVSLRVADGESVALVGLNGAGKSSLVKVLSGLLRARSGSVSFEGRDITAMSPANRTRAGLMVVPEGRQIFPTMTVAETLHLGTLPIPLSERRAKSKEGMELVYRLFPVLKSRQKQIVGTLSGGEQQMVAIARSIISYPKLLILDEPSLGLAPKLVAQIFAALEELRESGLTVLLVEQNAAIALNFCTRAYVFDLGHVVHEAPSSELRQSRMMDELVGVGEDKDLVAAISLSSEEEKSRRHLPEYSFAGRAGSRQ